MLTVFEYFESLCISDTLIDCSSISLSSLQWSSLLVSRILSLLFISLFVSFSHLDFKDPLLLGRNCSC